MRKIKFLALKEIRHILRDPRSLTIAVLIPILMTLLYGYAINLDIKNIKLAVMDFDRSSESRELINRFYNSGYFAPADEAAVLLAPEEVLRRGQAKAVLTVRYGFSASLVNNESFTLGLMIDGADANTASAAASYSEVILMQYLADRLPPGYDMPGINLSQVVRYNPDMKSSHFFVPGLIAVILMMISALLTSITIAREKETGTMEQLLTAPVKPIQIIAGKVIPYIGLALFDGLLVWAFAVFHFGVPMTGSCLLLLFFGVIYVIAALSLGILISALVRTQQLAMMAALVVTMLPSVMLSGFIFEIKNMPLILQGISYIIPARYFILIIRGIMLKGSGIAVLWPQAAALVLLTMVLLGIAIKKFKLKIG